MRFVSRFFDWPEARAAGGIRPQCDSRRTGDEKGSESVLEVPHTVTVSYGGVTTGSEPSFLRGACPDRKSRQEPRPFRCPDCIVSN